MPSEVEKNELCGEWRDIKEEKPPLNTLVLVYYDNDNFGLKFLYKQEDGRIFWSDVPFFQTITHWMPLPERP